MTTKHTPGPWGVDRWGNIHGHMSPVVAVIDETTCPPEQRSANARLIAASPDLLAVCEKIAETTWSRNVATKLGEQLRAAIKKARGET